MTATPLLLHARARFACHRGAWLHCSRLPLGVISVVFCGLVCAACVLQVDLLVGLTNSSRHEAKVALLAAKRDITSASDCTVFLERPLFHRVFSECAP